MLGVRVVSLLLLKARRWRREFRGSGVVGHGGRASGGACGCEVPHVVASTACGAPAVRDRDRRSVMLVAATGIVLAAAIIVQTLTIRSLMRRVSLLEGSSKTQPMSFREYRAHRKGSAK